VFDYNGFGRLDQPSPNAVVFGTLGLNRQVSSQPSWHRLLSGPFGEDTGWLLPAALVALGGSLVATRRRARTDLPRASLLLWGTWLVVLLIVFSVSTTINSYYSAALTPAVAGLLATGVIVAWEHRRSTVARLSVAAVVLGTAIYAAWLLPAEGVGVVDWLAPLVLGVGSAVALSIGLSPLFARAPVVLPALLCLGIASAMVVPVAASATAVANRLGSFDTPFEPPAVLAASQVLFGPRTRQMADRQLPLLEHLRSQFHTRDLMATQTAVVAAPTIYDSGQEVYPLGGYDGTGVAPTLGTFRGLIARNVFRVVVVSPTSADPRYRYVASHCLHVRGGVTVGQLRVFFCTQSAG
jgi:4-amino-4-deoxy-L-arabinose transferase-like glycosyltransferase